jgi:hypothetical protein
MARRRLASRRPCNARAPAPDMTVTFPTLRRKAMAAAVYVQTNDAQNNEIIAFGRLEDGSLTSLGHHSTEGGGPASLTCQHRAPSRSRSRARPTP